MASATTCMTCGIENKPCCVDKNGQPTANSCGTDKTLMCVEHMCKKSSGKYQEACGDAVKCDTENFPGLQCVAPPAGAAGAPDKWCDCGTDTSSAWKLCKEDSVCAPSGPSPGPSPSPGGDPPNCSTLQSPTYKSWKGFCSTASKDHGNGFAGAAKSENQGPWACDLANDDIGKNYCKTNNLTLCKWDIPTTAR